MFAWNPLPSLDVASRTPGPTVRADSCVFGGAYRSSKVPPCHTVFPRATQSTLPGTFPLPPTALPGGNLRSGHGTVKGHGIKKIVAVRWVISPPHPVAFVRVASAAPPVASIRFSPLRPAPQPPVGTVHPVGTG